MIPPPPDTPTTNMFGGKFVKWVKFLAALLECIFYNVEEAEIHKMSEVFWAKLYCRISDLFCCFFLDLRLSSRKSEINR